MNIVKNNYIICSIIVFLSSFLTVKADTCTTSEIQVLKEKAKLIEITSELDKNEIVEGDIYANNIISITGLSEDLFVMPDDESEIFSYEDVIDGTITKEVITLSKKFKVYPSKCESEKELRVIEVNTQKYNLYSEDKACEGIEDGELDVCDKYYQGDISYKEFIKKVEKYKEEKNKKPEEDDKINIFENKYVIGTVIALAIILLIVIILKNRKRYKLD